MKKTLFSFLVLLSLTCYVNVFASMDRDCTYEEITAGQQALENINYNLVFNENVTNEKGEKLVGTFNISFPTLPTDYIVEISQNDSGALQLYSSTDVVGLKGGVYNLDFYNLYCDTKLKEFSIFVPVYKKDCYFSENCNQKDNVWSDGTTPSTNTNNKTPKRNYFKILMIILITIAIAVVLLIAILIHRRRSYEKSI